MWWCQRGEHGSFMEWRGTLQVYITFTTAGITILCNWVLVVLRVCQDGWGLEVRRDVWRGRRRWGWGCVRERRGNVKLSMGESQADRECNSHMVSFCGRWRHLVQAGAVSTTLLQNVLYNHTTDTFTKWQSLVKHIHCISYIELELSKGMQNLGICSIISGRWNPTV